MDVYLSPLEENKLEELLDYLQERWPLRARKKFFKKDTGINFSNTISSSCQEISDFPNVRKCVVSKEASFYYQIHSSSIEIITVIDNREDPNRIFEDSDF